MINIIWLLLIVSAVVIGGITGKMDAVTKGAIDSAKLAVDIAIVLIGIMAMWLGIMKIAEKAGLIRALARVVKPVMKRLFPEVPAEHPAMGAMMMNLAANALGLGNAATPFGLKAMMELQKLNQFKEHATNAMCMFLTINTSSVTLIPITVIGIRASLGSVSPTEIIGTTLIATFFSTAAGITAVKLFEKLPVFGIKEELGEELSKENME